MAMNDLAVSDMKKVCINEENCKDCGLCIRICREGALTRMNYTNVVGFRPVGWSGDCSLCAKCVVVCLDFAISIK